MTAEIITENIKKINKILAGSSISTHGLYGGSLGLLLYYFHAGKKLNDKSLTKKANHLLEKVFTDMNENGAGLNGASLCSGGAGLAAVVNYLDHGGFIDFETDDDFIELDKFLFEDALASLGKDNSDYLHGPLGVILYFTTRQQTATINNYLNMLVEKLLSEAVHTSHGVWFKNDSWSDRDLVGKIDFGLAHGLCGILLILIEAYPHISDKNSCEHVIRNGIKLIIKYEIPVDFETEEYSFFPTSFGKDDVDFVRINRLAWCYGDLNEVLLLYRAGTLFNDNRYHLIADRIGLKTIERKSYAATLSATSHFCHGSAGLAQLYKAVYFETSNKFYKEAYEYWINDVIKKLDQEIETDVYKLNNVSFLEGWTGVALVLLDALSTQRESNWASLFLL